MQSGPERPLGVWEGTKASPAFWVKTIFTLSLWFWLAYRQNRITLTTRRLTQSRGNILTNNETSVDLEKISNIVVNKSALGSIFGYGDFIAETAGSERGEVSFKALSNPDRLRNMIFDIRDGKLDEMKNYE